MPDRIEATQIRAEEFELLQRFQSAVAQIMRLHNQPMGLLHRAALEDPTGPFSSILQPLQIQNEIFEHAEETEAIQSIEERSRARRHALDQAWHRLRNLLYNASLPGYVFSVRDGSTTPAPASIWGASALDLAHISATAHFPLDGREVSGRGRVRRDDLLAVLDGKAVQSQSSKINHTADARPEAPARNLGGAPAKHDSDLFLVGAFRLLNEEGFQPKTQMELNQRALDEYAKNRPLEPDPPDPDQQLPTPEWAKKKIRRLWNMLKLGESR